jgi:NAD(P)-dependent dehydrogenase (short-subunit alcohol dehydrogenase family)
MAPAPSGGFDVTNEAEWAAMMERIARRAGRMDIMVNNAGIYGPASLQDESAAGFRRMFEIRYRPVAPWLGLAMVRAQPDVMNAATLALTPMGRIGLPEEIAAGVVFLASDDASFVTGVAVPIDGGFTAQ